MTGKRNPITGFRITRPSAARSRMMRGNRVMWRSEVTRLLEECIASEFRRGLEHLTHRFPIAPATTPVDKPASLPPRKAFAVGRIDPSRSTLPILSEEEAKAIGGRETLMHFGLDPDLCPAT